MKSSGKRTRRAGTGARTALAGAALAGTALVSACSANAATSGQHATTTTASPVASPVPKGNPAGPVASPVPRYPTIAAPSPNPKR
jgi:hypothetical protein